MTSETERPRAWQRMLSGRKLDLLDPNPSDVELADIAHGLARVSRWNGQTVGDHAFSVAQHAIVVTDITIACNANWPAHWQLAALLHDSAEYVVGDLISPFKAAVGQNYRTIEDRILGAIYERFNLPRELPKDVAQAIKQADRTSAYFEATRLAGFEVDEASKYFGTPMMLPSELESDLKLLTPMPIRPAQRAFIARCEQAIKQMARAPAPV